jgi:hypothetical protein
MTKTERMIVSWEINPGFVQFATSLLGRVDEGSTLTMIIRRSNIGGFFVSAATQPSETTLR